MQYILTFFFLFFFYKYCPTLVDYCAVANARLSLPKLAISCWTTLRQTLSGKKVLFQLYSFSNSAIASRLLANRWTKCDFWFKKTLRLLSRFLCFQQLQLSSARTELTAVPPSTHFGHASSSPRVEGLGSYCCAVDCC